MPSMTVFSHVHDCKPVARWEFGYTSVDGTRVRGHFTKCYKCRECKNVFSEDLTGEKMLNHAEMLAKYKKLSQSKNNE